MLSAPGAFQAIMAYLDPGEVIQQVAVLTTGPATNWYAGVTRSRLIAVQLDPVWCEPIPKTRFAVPLSDVQSSARDLYIKLPDQSEPQQFHLLPPTASVSSPWDITQFKAALQAKPLEKTEEPAKTTPTTAAAPSDEFLQGARRYAFDLIAAGESAPQVESQLTERGFDQQLAAAIVKGAQERLLGIGPFASGHLRAQWTIGLFVATIIVALLTIMVNVLFLFFLNSRATPITLDQETLLETAQSGVAFLDLGVSVLTGILFLVWLHRVYQNLPVLGAKQLRFTPGSAIGWWFIPFINLVRPYQIVQEAWKASDPNIDLTDPYAWHKAPGSPLIGWWWGSFLFMSWTGGIFNAFGLSFIYGILEIIAAIPAIMLVHRIDARQEEKHRRKVLEM